MWAVVLFALLIAFNMLLFPINITVKFSKRFLLKTKVLESISAPLWGTHNEWDFIFQMLCVHYKQTFLHGQYTELIFVVLNN